MADNEFDNLDQSDQTTGNRRDEARSDSAGGTNIGERKREDADDFAEPFLQVDDELAASEVSRTISSPADTIRLDMDERAEANRPSVDAGNDGVAIEGVGDLSSNLDTGTETGIGDFADIQGLQTGAGREQSNDAFGPAEGDAEATDGGIGGDIAEGVDHAPTTAAAAAPAAEVIAPEEETPAPEAAFNPTPQSDHSSVEEDVPPPPESGGNNNGNGQGNNGNGNGNGNGQGNGGPAVTDGNDVVKGGVGDDVVNAGNGADKVIGGAGNDKIDGGAGNDRLSGGVGNDVLEGGTGNDRANGGVGDDIVSGGEGDDRVSGGSGNDIVDGGVGNDRVSGGSGDDVVSGGSGADILSGGSGNDTLEGGAGNDRANGGVGNDRVSGGSGDDVVSGGSGVDILSGGSGNDTLDGGTGNDRVYGGSGDDVVRGGSGADDIRGGSGDDVLDGGAGDDVLRGNAGADTFTFEGEFGDDTIRDFRVNQGDTIDLSQTGAADFDSLMSNATQSGNTTTLNLDGGTITLNGVRASDLTADNFEFAEIPAVEEQPAANEPEVFNIDFSDVLPEGADASMFEVRVSGLPDESDANGNVSANGTGNGNAKAQDNNENGSGNKNKEDQSALTVMALVGATIAIPATVSATEYLENAAFEVVEIETGEVVSKGVLDGDAIAAGESTVSVLPVVEEESVAGNEGLAKGHIKQAEKAAEEEAQAAEQKAEAAAGEEKSAAATEEVTHQEAAPEAPVAPPVVSPELPPQAAAPAASPIVEAEPQGKGNGNGNGQDKGNSGNADHEPVNQAPTDLSLSGNAIAENAANGTVVGTASATDPDAGETFTYSLTDDANGRFTINSSTGVVTVADGSQLDYEEATSHNVTIRVTDSGGNTYDEVMALNLTDVNEVSSDLSLDSNTVAENAANGTVVGTASATDPDAGETFTYSLTDNASGRFAIDATTGEITVADGSALDFDSATSHNVTIQVTDSGGNTYDESHVIGINEVTTINTSNYNSSGTGVTVTGRSIDGSGNLNDASTASVIQTASGLGVNGSTGSSAPVAQVGYDAGYDVSEELIFDFDGPVNSASVGIDMLYGSEGPSGGEQGHWQAYNNGVLVGEADFTSNVGEYTTNFNIDFGAGVTFDQIIFTGTEFAGGQGDSTSNSSEYYVSSVTVEWANLDLQGSALNQTLTGEAGNDTIDGGAGDDTLYGGASASMTIGSNLITNGSFEANGGSTDGWTNLADRNAQVKSSGSNGVNASDGSYAVDMDEAPGNASLQQAVSGLTSGTDYQLSFDAAEYTGYDGELEVYWNGELVATVDPESTSMATFTYTVEAGVGDGSDTLRFTEVGASDYGGTVIDNIELYEISAGDTLNGGRGNDTLIGGVGSDSLIGGDGTDTASYSTSASGVNVSLATGTGTGGDAQGDTLSGIENLTGSAYADTLTGDSGDNVLTGLGGNDTLTGGAGNDTFVFGEGDGNDMAYGGDGGGWTDTLQLMNSDGSSVGGGWTVTLTTGSEVSDSDGVMTLTEDAAGTVTLDDGSQIAFEGMERIEY